MLYFLLSLICWFYYGQKCYYWTNKNFETSILINSATHASFIVLAYLFDITGTTVYYVSLSYYILDTFYELINLVPLNNNKPIKIRLYNVGIFIHHIVIIYTLKYLTHTSSEKHMMYAFYLAELSNFPMYVVKYLKKNKYHNKIIINLFIVAEIIAYLYLRIYLGGYQAYTLLFEFDIPYTVIIASWLIIIISTVWTYKLIIQLYNKA